VAYDAETVELQCGESADNSSMDSHSLDKSSQSQSPLTSPDMHCTAPHRYFVHYRFLVVFR